VKKEVRIRHIANAVNKGERLVFFILWSAWFLRT
jgi:hypothetical protein